MNDGLGGTTFNKIDSATVEGKPSYVVHPIPTATFPTSSLGNTF
jgi:hypothetical protein